MIRNVAVCLLIIMASSASANPVRDDVAQEFRHLVEWTIAKGECPSEERLASFFARFGLQLLDVSHHRSIRRNYATFAPIVVESQRPGRRLQPSLQRLHANYADAPSRTEMAHALRGWLTDPITKLGGGFLVEFSDVVVQRERAKAAYFLVEIEDHRAAALIERWLREESLDDVARWQFEAARGRIDDRCFRRFLDVAATGEVRVCARPSDLLAVEWSRERFLDDAEVQRLLELLAGSEVGKNSNWSGGERTFRFETASGAEGRLSPTEPGRVTFYDESTQRIEPLITLENVALHDWLSGLEP